MIPALLRERLESGYSMKLNTVSRNNLRLIVFLILDHLKVRLMEPGAIGQGGAAALRPAGKASRSRRGPVTIPLRLTEERSALVNGKRRETALSVCRI